MFFSARGILKASTMLISLYLPLVLSVYQAHFEDVPHTSVGAGLHNLPQSPQAMVEHNFNVLERKRRAPKSKSRRQPSAQLSENPSLMKNNTYEYKVVCYYTNYAWYRTGIGKYSPRDIDPELCTHIVYGFGMLDPDQLIIKPNDKWADIDSKLYEKVTELKKKGVKVLIAIGGWEDSAGNKYSRLVNSPTRRRRFIEHMLQFMYEHNFNGLELDWEYPKCWQLNCSAGPDSDKDAFAALVRELRQAFEPHGLLLSASVSPTKLPIDVGYNVPLMSEKLDWITVKTYDYHGHWDKRTGHGAPLYAQPDDDVTLSVNFTIHYWISKGADSRKLVLGIPMFGNSFKLDSADNNGLYASSSGSGESGEQSKVPGILSYYEICNRIKERQWKLVQDANGTMGPYTTHHDQWVSFDDPATVRRKSEYVKQNNLGGVMVFSLDYDDFRNNCGSGKYPLLRTINSVLRNYPDPGLDSRLVSTEQHTTKGPTTQPHTTVPPTATMSTAEATSSGKIVCYFTNWSRYREGLGMFLPSNINSSLCTHIVYAFAILEPKSLTVQSQDKWTDLDNDFFGQVTRLKQKGIKVLLGVGGWNDTKGDKYSRLVNNPDARAHFISHLSEFLRRHNFDGVNLHWEYPVCWQLDCDAGPASDKEGFSALVTELSQELKPRGLLISSIVARNNMVIENAYDVKTLVKHLDWLEVKAYDYHGSWDGHTGHESPLYYTERDITPFNNVNSTVHYWLGAGAPKDKLVLGIPLYAQTYTLEDPSLVAVGAPTKGQGNPGPFTTSAGIMAFYEICDKVKKEGWKIENLPLGSVAHHNDQWVSYNDIPDIRRKTEYINDLGLGGAMVWALDHDDFNNICGCGNYPILRTLNHGLRYSNIPQSVSDTCAKSNK